MTGRGLFCLAGVQTYPAGVPDLNGVPEELRSMRQTLRALGLDELFHFEGEERDHRDLADELQRLVASGAAPEADTLVVYCTGHGDGSARYQLLRGDGTTFAPAGFVVAVEKWTSLKQVVLIVDACFSGGGAWNATREAQMPGTETSDKGFWSIAASRRVQPAGQRAFARAFADVAARSARPSWTEQYLDPGLLAIAINEQLPAAQTVWLAGGHPAGVCRVLPNPHHQHRARPMGLPLDAEWSACARGVATPDAPGFFFTGRRDELRRLRMVAAGGASSAVVTGRPGSGKTALLGHLVLTITNAGNSAMPASARKRPSESPMTVIAGRGDYSMVLRSLARALPGSPSADAGEVVRAVQDVPEPVLVVLDQLDEADPAPWEHLLADLDGTPGVRLVIALPAGSRIRFPTSSSIVDLDACPDTKPDVRDFLRLRVLLARPSAPDHEIDQVVDRLEDLCHGRFDVAVEVAARHDEAGETSTSGDEAGWADAAADAALRAAYRLLDKVPAGRAAAIVDAIAALCSFDPSIGLPATEWAAAASDPRGAAVAPADVARAAAQLEPLLRRWAGPDGSPRWRWVFGYPARRVQSRDRHLARLPQLIAGPPGAGVRVDPALLKLLARAAAVTTARGRWVDDPRFLLEAPRTLVQAAVRNLPVDSRDQARRSHLLRPTRLSGSSVEDRAFLLAIDARRYGVEAVTSALSASGNACGPRIVWCQPDRFGSDVVDLAFTPGPPGVAVTVHEDGEVAFWSVADGTATRPPVDRVPGGVKHLAAATLDGAAMGYVSSARGEIWSISGRDEAPPALLHRLDPPGLARMAPPIAVHPAGPLVVGCGREVLVADSPGSRLRLLAQMDTEIVHVRVAGPLDAPVAWVFSTSGRIRRLPLDGSASRGHAVFPVHGAPLKAAVTRDGERALIVDSSAVVHLRGINSGDGLLPGTRPPTVRAVAGKGAQSIVGGGSFDELGWLEAVGVGDPVSARRIPLDQPPYGIEFVEDDVLIARRCGLLLISLKPGSAPVPTKDR